MRTWLWPNGLLPHLLVRLRPVSASKGPRPGVGETRHRRAPGFPLRAGGWLGPAAMLPLALWGTPHAAAQDAPAAPLPPPLTLSHVEGRVEIAGASGLLAAQAPDILEDGDRLITADGRAELVYADGSLAHVDRGTDVHIDADARLRVVRGRIVVRTAPGADPIDVATPVGVVRLEPRGEYLVGAGDLDADTVVAAVTGRATLALPAADVPIAADDELRVDPRGLEPRWFRIGGRRDAFTDWAAQRVADMRLAQGTQPLPPELSAYAPAFAAHGRWDTMPPYGPVWFPTAAPGWRPYANGHWRHTRYGWTWIDLDPWGWPVHHYGRWGRHAARGWYWIPRRTWGPAWVGWAIESGHVGWAPLGWNSRPVVDFFVGARVGPFDLWAGSWSVVPRAAFGRRGPIGPYFADLRRLPAPVLGGFVVQGHGPRGPAGWRAPRAYRGPVVSDRVPRAFDRGRPPASGRDAAPRAVPRPRATREVPSPMPPRSDVRQPEASREGRTWRDPARRRDDSREVAPRRDARRPSDAPMEDSRPREASPAPRRAGGADAGRPAPAPGPGRARERAERDGARPRAAGSTPGRGPSRDTGTVAATPSRGSGAAGGARRRPR